MKSIPAMLVTVLAYGARVPHEDPEAQEDPRGPDELFVTGLGNKPWACTESMMVVEPTA